MIDNSIFDEAFQKVIRNEGEYVNDPDDPGGETKYGISKRVYPELNINALTLEDAKKIYKRDYWCNIGLDRISHQDIAIKLFDLAVNVGCKVAIKILQRALRAVSANKIILKEDGILGEKTHNALLNLNELDNYNLLNALRSEAAGYYRSLNNDRFINGWLNRAYS